MSYPYKRPQSKQAIQVKAATKEKFDAACSAFSMEPDAMVNWLLGLIPRLFVAGQGGVTVQANPQAPTTSSSIVYDPDTPPANPPGILRTYDPQEPGSNPIIVLETGKFFVKPTVIGPDLNRIISVYQQMAESDDKPDWQQDDWLSLGDTGFSIK